MTVWLLVKLFEINVLGDISDLSTSQQTH